jgi:gamma-carbonic anhydrase
MAIYKYMNHKPIIGDDCFIAPDASIIGEVEIGNNVNIWFNTVLRADGAKIVVGDNTNIQDLSMLHIDRDTPLIIGKNVTVGHKATLHACTIEDSCLIGMDAVVLNGAKIGRNSVVAAGSVVPPGKEYPPGSMIMGSPAKAVKELTPELKEQFGNHYKTYVELAKTYLQGGLEVVDS